MINIVTDYKGFFGTKYDADPYRSGFSIKSLQHEFHQKGIKTQVVRVRDLSDYQFDQADLFLLTSSDDIGGKYKGFLDDLFFDLKCRGGRLIPNYELFRAHENKVYAELIRKRLGFLWNDKLESSVFGCFEELENSSFEIPLPIVVKKSRGALSRGVFLALDKYELYRTAKRASKDKWSLHQITDWIRAKRHKGYVRESKNREKFILQRYIPDLKNDWKILVYGNRLFILTRHTRKNDFRASGSHCNYLPGSKSIIPEGIFDFALKIRDGLDVPCISLDIVFDGNVFYVVEFQAIHFGTSTINMSDVFFEKKDETWHPVQNNLSVEYLYADAVCWYLHK